MQWARQSHNEEQIFPAQVPYGKWSLGYYICEAGLLELAVAPWQSTQQLLHAFDWLVCWGLQGLVPLLGSCPELPHIWGLSLSGHRGNQHIAAHTALPAALWICNLQNNTVVFLLFAFSPLRASFAKKNVILITGAVSYKR